MDNHYWNRNGPPAYTEQDINAAIESGVLSEDAARSLREFVTGRSVADEEHFRLVSGFNDIFVTLASVMSLIALFWLVPGQIAGLPAAALAWVLSEYFVRKKRLALTAIALLLSYFGGIYYTAARCVYLATGSDYLMLLIPSLAMIPATVLHWKRFHVPITIMGGAAACVASIVVLVLLITSNQTALAFALLICGLAVFLFAMYFDSRDPYRRSRKSDIAFWLHLLAAPMIVHPFFYFVGAFKDTLTLWQAGVIIVIYIFMAFVSVCVDRRAMMVSSLAYVLYAFNFIISSYGALDMGIALAALIIGTALLSLSALWQPARAFIIRRIPLELRAKLPPVI